MEDDGTFEVGSRYSEGISLPLSPLRSPSAGALGRCSTPLPTEKERGKGGRGGNGVLFSPSRVDFLGSFQQRRGRGKEGGEVRWSLERTSERTRRRVSARSRSREGGRALRRRRYHARWGREVAEQSKITRGKVGAILQVSCLAPVNVHVKNTSYLLKEHRLSVVSLGRFQCSVSKIAN